MSQENKDQKGEVTPRDLMAFMESFRSSMEGELKKTNVKLDARLDIVEKEITKVNDKMENLDKNEAEGREARTRMEERLLRLEKEMENSLRIREKRKQLIEKNLKDGNYKEKESFPEALETLMKRRQQIQDDGNNRKEDQPQEEAWGKNVESDKPEYQSTWAKSIEKDLEEATKSEWVKVVKEKDTTKQKEIERKVPESWEELLHPPRAVKPKVRKPLKITSWFGEANSDTSTDNTDEEAEWRGEEEEE